MIVRIIRTINMPGTTNCKEKVYLYTVIFHNNNKYDKMSKRKYIKETSV